MSDLALRRSINALAARSERYEREVARLQRALQRIAQITWEPGARRIAIDTLNGEADGAA